MTTYTYTPSSSSTASSVVDAAKPHWEKTASRVRGAGNWFNEGAQGFANRLNEGGLKSAFGGMSGKGKLALGTLAVAGVGAVVVHRMHNRERHMLRQQVQQMDQGRGF